MLKNQKGQSSVEYLLIVAVLVVAIFAFGEELTKALSGITGSVFKKVGTTIEAKIGSAK